MANTQLFRSLRGLLSRRTDTSNAHGAPAYTRSPEAALALYACTGCLNGTFYAEAGTQLGEVLALAHAVPPAYLARTAILAREEGRMKDMPLLLLALLSLRDGEAFEAAFPRVVDNGRQLRSFVQIMRSGQVGRKSLGTRPKRLVQAWLANATPTQLIGAAVGEKPSLADVLKMVHPKPADAERQTLYAWLVGRPHDVALLPQVLRDDAAFREDATRPLPALPFAYLSSRSLSVEHWKALARRVSWQTLRMNLNTFLRNGVFEDPALVAAVAARLADPEEVRRSGVLPYQLMAAWKHADETLPAVIRGALEVAMEIATASVPRLQGGLAIAVDVSGSMGTPLTGYRKGGTSKLRCVDAAALLAASLWRANPQARVLPFDTEVRRVALSASDPLAKSAESLAALCGGGTAVSAPLVALNRAKAGVSLVVLVSDNESWRDTRQGPGTATMQEWAALKARCPAAKLVCVDLQPVPTSQSDERPDVLHVGGFSDAVFERIAAFAGGSAGEAEAARWQARVEAVAL